MKPGAIRVGIGGWRFPEWRGPFYPEALPQRRELEFASRCLAAIEIDATFYGRQKPASWKAWAAEVPPGFRFTVKASRYSTTRKVLADGGESVSRFLEQGLTLLGEKLGPILWQFAPAKSFERDDFARFLDLLPPALDGVPLRHALEVRHESFRDPAFFALARERNAAVVFADSDQYPCIDEPTAEFTYARLQRTAADCETGYAAAALDHWATRAKAWAEGGREVFLFVIAGAKVRNPAASMALIERIGSR